MRRLLCLLCTLAMLSSGAGMQIHAQTPADVALYAVSYVEVRTSAKSSMVAAFTRYRDASRKEDGYVRFEMLEQVGRPGHFAILETWKDQKAFDAHGMAAPMKQFRDALQPIRLSGYDQAPYKPITVGSVTAARNDQAIHVLAHVDTVPAARAEAPALLKRLAEASRQEQGSLQFDVVQHTMRPNHFTVIETWQSQSALDAHADALHTKEYRDVLQPMAGGPLDERVYKAVE